MANLQKLIKMNNEPASKEWFKKYGLPKAIKNHALKKKMASKIKMSSHGELAKAEKGETQHKGKAERKLAYNSKKYSHWDFGKDGDYN